MNKELYFLRSWEQKIVNDMVKLAHTSDTTNLNIYTDFYGLTTKDLGLYALVNNEIAGAIWSRKIDGDTPIISFAIVPKFKKQGIGIFMMEQFLQEAGALYEEISIDITHKPKAIKFYEKFGFEKIQDTNSLIMIKKLEKKEVVRPTDGYDPTRWMD
ncbi:MAG: GNAT family N-acetyltransferase [Campylobacterota bacterium]|nr:GNAT family N-acetyltransferase [Campylobacterota bacterium]